MDWIRVKEGQKQENLGMGRGDLGDTVCLRVVALK